jgi:ribosome-binding factor A
MPTRRIARLNEQLRADLADLIVREVKDPRLSGLVTVTNVDLSPDLRHAKVFVSVLGTDDDRKHSLAALRSASGFLRSQIAHRLTTKRAPDLQFVSDVSIERGERIMQIIRQVEHESGDRESSDGPESDPKNQET